MTFDEWWRAFGRRREPRSFRTSSEREFLARRAHSAGRAEAFREATFISQTRCSDATEAGRLSAIFARKFDEATSLAEMATEE